MEVRTLGQPPRPVSGAAQVVESRRTLEVSVIGILMVCALTIAVIGVLNEWDAFIVVGIALLFGVILAAALSKGTPPNDGPGAA